MFIVFFHNYNWLCKASYNWGSHLLGSLAWGTLFVETTAFYSILIWGPGQRHHRFKVITYSDRLIEFWVLNHPTNWVFLSSKDSSRCWSLKPPASGENAMDTSKKNKIKRNCVELWGKKHTSNWTLWILMGDHPIIHHPQKWFLYLDYWDFWNPNLEDDNSKKVKFGAQKATATMYISIRIYIYIYKLYIIIYYTYICTKPVKHMDNSTGSLSTSYTNVLKADSYSPLAGISSSRYPIGIQP